MYEWLEAQRAWMRSFDTWTAQALAAWGMHDAHRALVAAPGCDWLYRLAQPTPEPPPFGISAVTLDGRSVPVVEEVVDSTPFCELRRFARSPANDVSQRRIERNGGGASILLCTPLAGHHAVMLRETVETLLVDADVHITDWADARDVPLAAGRFGLDDYVLAIKHFLHRLSGAGVHVVAVCQATAPTLAAAALLASEGAVPPLSLTLMGGPIDTRLNPTAVDRLAESHSIDWFRRTVIDTVPSGYAGAGRRIYPGYVQHAAIVAAHPHRQLALEARYWESRLTGDTATIAANLRALNEYAAVLDMAEDYFLETLRVIFQEQRLARGTWRVDGRDVRPQDLVSSALCTVEGDRDDITGAGQTHAAHDICSGIADAHRARLTIGDCDHYDLFTGPRWRDTIHPAVQRFWQSAHKRRPRSLDRPARAS